jgi:hypothetical protein
VRRVGRGWGGAVGGWRRGALTLTHGARAGGRCVGVVLCVVQSRGTTRHLYDFSFELEYKVSSEGEGGEGEEEVKPTTVCRGSLSYSEVACSKTTGTVQVGDVANQFKSDPTAEQKPAALGAIGTLKGQVHAVLAQFDADYRASKKI